MNASNQILIISHDVVGPKMAGPGIRYFNLARVLAREFDVLLAVPDGSGGITDLPVLQYAAGNDACLEKAICQARTVLVPAVQVAHIPVLETAQVPIVIDGYDPYLAETLYTHGDTSNLQTILTQAYLLGDFFICASERQRDWWLGLLEAHGRINPYTFGEDASLRQLVDLVPFGLSAEPPCATKPVMKDVWPGIGPEDKVVLWGGGLWPWLDPLTAIRAMALVWQQRQDVRLVFPGTRHPNVGLSSIPTHNQAAWELADKLELLDRAVFFGEWIPYNDWPNVLLESDLALTLHLDTLETRLAFRSRVLDYIWAGLPVVATRGDATSDLIENYQLGMVVDYGDEMGVAMAILSLLAQPKDLCQEQFEVARQALTWERAAQPLLKFCRQPRRAADRRAVCVGNPYYQEQARLLAQQLVEKDTEITRLQETIAGYERGRFIRLMKRLRHSA